MHRAPTISSASNVNVHYTSIDLTKKQSLTILIMEVVELIVKYFNYCNLLPNLKG